MGQVDSLNAVAKGRPERVRRLPHGLGTAAVRIGLLSSTPGTDLERALAAFTRSRGGRGRGGRGLGGRGSGLAYCFLSEA